MSSDEPSYIDYEVFLSPSFSAVTFANQLVLNTNHPSDTPVDLSTPLSKVLFDVQEIDTHIDSLTTKSAAPLLEYTTDRAEASQRILDEVEAQVTSLTEAYKVLQREVTERYEAAEQVRVVADRLNQTVRLARGVSRSVLLGRQLQVQMTEYNGPASSAQVSNAATAKKQDFRAMVRAAHTLSTLKSLLASNASPRDEGYGLGRVTAITALKTELVQPTEAQLVSRAAQTVREFSMSALVVAAAGPTGTSSPSRNATAKPASSSAPTYTQNEETKTRATSALLVLYLLSPPPAKNSVDAWTDWTPRLAITALQEYMQTALRSSLASLARSLATLPTLDRTLLELSARCQNIVALEALLESLVVPVHPAQAAASALTVSGDGGAKAYVDEPQLDQDQQGALLPPLLAALDTPSLPSFFWRTLASALSKPVNEILSKGGVSARQLKANKDRVRDAVRACVDRGSRVPDAVFDTSSKTKAAAQRKGWEREAAVMVAAVVGSIR
jgi:Golgi transport complex subunit 5